MGETVIRRMRSGDIDSVHAIEEATFAVPWSRDSFEREIEKNAAARYLVAVRDGRIIGYGGAWIILDESHVTNIAVAEDARGQGVGRKLTEELMQYLSNLGAAYATLEVRVSNLRAQNLYKSLGFVTVGKRKRYYEDNGEDALLMVCTQMPPVNPEFEETGRFAATEEERE